MLSHRRTEIKGTKQLPEIIRRKKLIEVAMPLDLINESSAKEKLPGIGPHPRGLHLWWARRPLSAARAILFCQIVDDPSSHPELFPTEKQQQKERERLFRLVEQLILWKSTHNEDIIQKAQNEIWKSWRLTCADNIDHPRAKELFDPEKLPSFNDPFAGGGALPLEAQRLGLEAHAGDLNPVAVLMNKAMIEIPPKFAGFPPVNPGNPDNNTLFNKEWSGSQGLAEDVCYYGQWMKDEAEKRIGHLYPKVEVTAQMAKDCPDLKQYVDQKLTVVAWLWSRTVKSPNPAFSHVEVPLVTTFMLSTKKGKEAYVEPIIEDGDYRFLVKYGKPANLEVSKKGTKISRGTNFQCLMSGIPIGGDYIKTEGKSGRMGARLMAIVAEGPRRRVYISPTPEMEAVALEANPTEVPETDLPLKALGFGVQIYGMTKWRDLFTARQLAALTTFSDLVQEARTQLKQDAIAKGMPDDGVSLASGGNGSTSYADAVSIYLAFAVDRIADFNSSLATWKSSGEQAMHTFTRQVIPMVWDFTESNVLGKSAICFEKAIKYTADALLSIGSYNRFPGVVTQSDATNQPLSHNSIISTDPPYYDNIGYGDLSDFFYIWLRSSLRTVFPSLFSTVTVPKNQELIASVSRHGDNQKANKFFLDNMKFAIHQLAEQTHKAFPITIYYAYKQTEARGDNKMVSTGWETFLEAVISEGLEITGTWPIRSEQKYRMRAMGSNSLSSSIVLVCRARNPNALAVTRREFIASLRTVLLESVKQLRQANVAPVDLAQAVMGPGMSVFTKYSKVLNSSGKPVSVKDALAMINETLDWVLGNQGQDIDYETRFAVRWFETWGISSGDYGMAQGLAVAMNLSVEGVAEAGIIQSGAGKVRLVQPEELSSDWNPTSDSRLTTWEVIHHLIKNLDSGEESAAQIISKLSSEMIDLAKGLAYRLYTICEQKNWPEDGFRYNSLIQSWPEIERLARLEEPAQQGNLI